ALAAVVGVGDALGVGDQVGARLHAGVDVGVAQLLGLQVVTLGLQLGDLGILVGERLGVGLLGIAQALVRVLNLPLQLLDGLGAGVGRLDLQTVDQDGTGLGVSHGCLPVGFAAGLPLLVADT